MRIKVNGLSINNELSGRGKTLVLTHGMGGDLTAWAEQVPVFSQHYQVLTWDVRGHGQSDRPLGEYTAELFTDDLYRLLKRLDIGEAFILGHSMGGVIVQRFVLDHPEMTKALIISSSSSECNATAAKAYKELATLVERERPQSLPIPPEMAFSAGFRERNPEVVARFYETIPQPDPESYPKACQAMAALHPHPLTPELERITCPTLILVGDQDLMTPPGGSVIMSRRIPGSRLKIFKDCGHVSYLERPEEFNATVLEFLASVEV